MLERALRTLKNPQRVGEIRRCRAATPEWKQLLGAYAGFGFHTFSIRLASGPFEFREKSDVATFWQVFFRGVYPLRASDRLIVDAGGNIGAFSLYALLTLPECRVISIEPSPSSFARLVAALKANGVADRCMPIQAALGAADGESTLNESGPSQFRRVGAGGVTVPMARLESVLPAEGEIDLLKMDTEGGEYDTLENTADATLTRIRRIAMEYHPSEGAAHRWPALRQRLISAGFRVQNESHDGGGYGMAYLER